MAENHPPKRGLNKTRVITHVLTKALKLWLKSQVSQVSDLTVEIKASDRQLFSGSIPWVSIFASHAVYQDLHITQIQLAAENIQVNIGQILKGKPLQLLQVVPVVGELCVEEQDLNSSLSSELLSTGLNELLDKLLPESGLKSKPILWEKIILDHQHFTIKAILTPTTEPAPLEISSHLKLISKNELQLSHLQVKKGENLLLESSDNYNIDLGSDVNLQELSLMPDKLICRGQVNVNP